MKKIFLLFALLPVLLIYGLFWHFSVAHDKPKEKKIPGNPGWYEQYFQMKKNADGIIPLDLIKSIRQQQRSMRGSGSGNLLNIAEIGPSNVGGRTRALLIDLADSTHIIAGGVSGGIWNSFDRGLTWAPVNDFNATLSVTGLTQNPFLPKIFYYSTGESTGNSAGVAGDGVYKSTDGGLSFKKLLSTTSNEFNYIWSIKASLVDSHTVFVATRNSGLFRSTDGGDTFEKIFSASTRSINDIEVFPDSTVMVTVNGDGIYMSPDGSPNSFTRLTGGLPGFGFRRIEMAYAPSNPDVLYAVYENSDGNDLRDIFKSTDGGANWVATTNPSTVNNISFAFPWYCLTAAVSPVNPNVIIVGSVGLTYSMDGGAFWIEAAYSHADYHTIVFDPYNSEKVYIGNDGGIYEYEMAFMDMSRKPLNNGYNVTQFYTGAYFPTGIDIFGGTQDNGTQSTKNGAPEFKHIYGGDGAYTQINQQNPDIAYVSYQRGQIKRTDFAGNMMPSFYDIKFEMDSNGDGDIDDNAWFINPFEINLLDGEQLYFVTMNKIWRTVTGGLTWEPLTANISSSGQPYSVGISNDVNPTVYIGGSSGLLFRIDSAATAKPGDEVSLKHSMNVSLKQGFISNIAVNPNNDSIIYVAFSNFSTDPRIWKVSNAKSSTPKWESIGGNLPIGLPINWIQIHPQKDSIIVAATDFGLYTTTNGGATWQLEQEIPNVSIHMVKLRATDGKLFIFTHGRGIWIADMPHFIPAGISTMVRSENQLTIMPNPVRDLLKYKTEFQQPHQYEIFDISGRMILQGTGSNEIVVSHIKKGTYFLKVTEQGKKPVVKRFIKI